MTKYHNNVKSALAARRVLFHFPRVNEMSDGMGSSISLRVTFAGNKYHISSVSSRIEPNV